MYLVEVDQTGLRILRQRQEIEDWCGKTTVHFVWVCRGQHSSGLHIIQALTSSRSWDVLKTEKQEIGFPAKLEKGK